MITLKSLFFITRSDNYLHLKRDAVSWIIYNFVFFFRICYTNLVILLQLEVYNLHFHWSLGLLQNFLERLAHNLRPFISRWNMEHIWGSATLLTLVLEPYFLLLLLRAACDFQSRGVLCNGLISYRLFCDFEVK